MEFLKRMKNIRFSNSTIEQKISLLCIFLVLLTGGAAVVHSVTKNETEHTNMAAQKNVHITDQISEKVSEGKDFPVVELEQEEKDRMIKDSRQNQNIETSSDETAVTGENDEQKESLIESQKTNGNSPKAHNGKKNGWENNGSLPSNINKQEGTSSNKNDQTTEIEEGKNDDENNTNDLELGDQPANDEENISDEVPGNHDEPIDKEQPSKGDEPVDGEEPGNEPIDNQEPGEDSPGNENQENHDTLDEQNETIDHKVD